MGMAREFGRTLKGRAGVLAVAGLIAGSWWAGGIAGLAFAGPVAAVFLPLVFGRYPGEKALSRARARSAMPVASRHFDAERIDEQTVPVVGFPQVDLL